MNMNCFCGIKSFSVNRGKFPRIHVREFLEIKKPSIVET
jgi:hypothetical protein